MANTSTKLYNENKQQIYPISIASAIQVDQAKYSSTSGNVEQDLINLDARINSLTNDDELISGLQVEIKYVRSRNNEKTQMLEDIKSPDNPGWSDSFSSPNSEYKYCWKRTTFSLSGQAPVVTYEIIATYIPPYKTRTYYYAGTSTTCDFKVPYIPSGGGDAQWEYFNHNRTEDIAWNTFEEIMNIVPDNRPVNEGWKEYPDSLVAGKKYLFMISLDTDEEGKWRKFKGDPALIGYNDSGPSTENNIEEHPSEEGTIE